MESVELTEQKESIQQTASFFVTWEMLVWAGVLAVAFLLRFANLGETPLTMSESTNALLGWNTYLGRGVSSMPSGGLLTYGTALIFFLFGASDASVRLLPAACGVLMVALPWQLRGVMGRTPALIAAFLLAVSPSMVQYSRRVDSVMLVALLSGFIVVAAIQLIHGGSRRWSYATALACGFLLVSGPVGYTSLVAVGFAAFALIWHWWPAREKDVRLSVSTLWSRLVLQERVEDGSKRTNLATYRFGIVAIGAALLIATGLLSNLAGVQQGIIDVLEVWGQGIAMGLTSNGLPRVVAYLLTYEPLLTVLGFGSAFILASRRRVWWGGALLWWQVGIVLAGAFFGQPVSVVLVLFPLALTAGWAGEQLVNGFRDREKWSDVISFVPVILALSWLVIFAQAYFTRPDAYIPVVALPMQSEPISPSLVATILSMAPILLLVLSLSFFLFHFGWVRIRLPALTVLSVALVIMAFHTNALSSASPFGVVNDAVVSADVRNLTKDLKQAYDAGQWLGSNRKVRVDASLRVPMAWYLRGMDVVFSQQAGRDDYIVVAPSEQTAPNWSRVARNYILSQSAGPGNDFGDWWIWYFYREPTGQATTNHITMYIRL